MAIRNSSTVDLVGKAEQRLRDKGSQATVREYSKAARAWMARGLESQFTDYDNLRVDRLVALASEKGVNDPVVLMTRARHQAISAYQAKLKGDIRFLADSRKVVKSIAMFLADNPNNEFWQNSSYMRQASKLLRLLK